MVAVVEADAITEFVGIPVTETDGDPEMVVETTDECEIKGEEDGVAVEVADILAVPLTMEEAVSSAVVVTVGVNEVIIDVDGDADAIQLIVCNDDGELLDVTDG